MKVKEAFLKCSSNSRINMKNLAQGFIVSFICAGCSLFGIGSEEQPNYKVLINEKNKQIREYAPHLIAKTTVQGSFKDTQSEGFKILAGYIFGKNETQQKIEMTSPVIQAPESEKIAMTAPVILSQNEDPSWTMTFSMPSQYSIETLPKPTDPRIIIEQVEIKTFAALRFTGFWGEKRNRDKGIELMNWLKTYDQFEIISKPMFAGYNPPWTLPFLRRNEMLIEIRQKK
jgi:hypothetical protein